MNTQRWIWLIVGLFGVGIVLLVLYLQSVSSAIVINRVKPIFFAQPAFVHAMRPTEAQRRLKQLPNDIEALQVLQDYHASRGEWDKSIVYAQGLIELGSKDINVHLGYVFALVNLGRVKEAKAFIQRTIKSTKDRTLAANLWRVLGDIYLFEYEADKKRSSLTLAKRAYTQCSNTLKDVPMCELGIARVAFQEGKYEMAREILHRVVQHSSYPRERAIAKYYLALIAYRQGKHSEAMNLLTQAIEEHPESFTGFRRK